MRKQPLGRRQRVHVTTWPYPNFRSEAKVVSKYVALWIMACSPAVMVNGLVVAVKHALSNISNVKMYGRTLVSPTISRTVIDNATDPYTTVE